MKPTLAACLMFLVCSLSAQQNVAFINKEVKPVKALAPLYFLASDSLKGRDVFRPEIKVAAEYIRQQFKEAGLLAFPQAADYFQPFPIGVKPPPYITTLKVGKFSFERKTGIVQSTGPDVSLNAPLIYIGSGIDTTSREALGSKIVLLAPFSRDANSEDIVTRIRKTQFTIKGKGAVALLIAVPPASWDSAANKYTSSKIVNLGYAEGLPIFYIKDNGNVINDRGKELLSASLNSKSDLNKSITGQNVIGYLKGTDPSLSDQFVILSAHYDHIGVTDEPVFLDGKLDSIFNGARDNASGTTAVIAAAHYFVNHPAKRPIIFAAFSGEERGLLGSAYFAKHPLLPLNKIYCGLNIDNGGYNDTTIITLVGSGKTTLDPLIADATATTGLKMINDPAPEAGLFEDSDNAPFTTAGVPDITFSLGFTAFDKTIFKYLHRVIDETGNMDMNYVMKYIKAYIASADAIANSTKAILWNADDEHEQTWHKLYKK